MLLLTPGPTPLPDEVREAMRAPMLHHRTDAFRAIQREVNAGLRRVFRTSGPVVSIAGSGTAAFEAAQLSLARPGDCVVTCASGKFGERWQAVYERAARAHGLTNVRVSAEWGAPIDPQAVDEALAAHPQASVVTLVHSETSTATVSDARAIAEIVRARAPEALLIVDGITSVGAFQVETDAWGLDAVVSGSQKALMCPPGIGFVALAPRALERLRSFGAEGSPLAPLYLDLSAQIEAAESDSWAFTAPVTLVYALRAALRLIEHKGLEARWARVRRLATATRSALEAGGLRLASSSPSDSVTAVWLPEGCGDEIRARCEEAWGVQLAGGQGPWKGRVVRMSHMGAIGEEETIAGVEALLGALEEAGADVAPRAARREVRKQLSEVGVDDSA